jgi:hypothetical protein
MLPQQASFLTSLVVIPSVIYVLYRTVVPYEPVMRNLEIGSALMFPLLAGTVVGFAHIVVDPPLFYTFWGVLVFLLIYPFIETLAVLTIFNRRHTMKDPAAPVYFAIGGAGLAMGMAAAESYRSFAALGEGSAEPGLIVLLFVLSTSFVIFHCAKAAYLGTYAATGRHRRGVVRATLLELPLGLLYFAERIGEDDTLVIVAMLLYSVFIYMWVWRTFFPAQMPEALSKALRKERRRARTRRERRGAA